jgi:hypothetical protein
MRFHGIHQIKLVFFKPVSLAGMAESQASFQNQAKLQLAVKVGTAGLKPNKKKVEAGIAAGRNHLIFMRHTETPPSRPSYTADT